MTIALPPPEDRSFADVWSALGGELKPSLDIVVSAPTWTGRVYPAAPHVQTPPEVSMGGVDGDWPPREGRARRATDRAGTARAPRRGAEPGAPAQGAARGRPVTTAARTSTCWRGSQDVEERVRAGRRAPPGRRPRAGRPVPRAVRQRRDRGAAARPGRSRCRDFGVQALPVVDDRGPADDAGPQPPSLIGVSTSRAAADRAAARPGQPVRAALRLPQRRRDPPARERRTGPGAGRCVAHSRPPHGARCRRPDPWSTSGWCWWRTRIGRS